MIDNALQALIIDDSPTDARALKFFLQKRMACQVESAVNGIDGLDKISRQPYDIVFLDLLMPMMSGVEVLAELRAAPETADIPVIILSGDSDPQTVRSVLQHKIFDYIVKPFNPTELAKRLGKKLVDLRSLARVRASLPLAEKGSPNQAGRGIVLAADADGKFRHFCANALAGRFDLIEAANGAQAIGMAIQYRPRIILAGARLGVFDRDHMVAKLRAVPALEGVLIFAVDGDGDRVANQDSLYDGRIKRTFVPEVFREAFDRLLSKAGQADAPKSTAESLRDAQVAAAKQVFGVLLCTDLTVTDNPPNSGPGAAGRRASIALISYGEEKRIDMVFRCGQEEDVAKIVAQMHGIDAQEAGGNSELAQSSLAEILKLIGDRLKGSLDEAGRVFLVGQPSVTNELPGNKPATENGVLWTHFAAADGMQFSIGLSTEQLVMTTIAKSALREGMILGRSTIAGGGAALAKGTRLDGTVFTRLRAYGPDEIVIIDAGASS